MPIDDELQILPDNFALHEVGESSRKRLKVLKRKFSDSDYLVECRIVMEAIGKKIMLSKIQPMLKNRK